MNSPTPEKNRRLPEFSKNIAISVNALVKAAEMLKSTFVVCLCYALAVMNCCLKFARCNSRVPYLAAYLQALHVCVSL